MHDINQLRKNKISLQDYNYKHDIENRLVMAQFSALDLEVLEEILYSSIKIPIRKLAKTLDLEDEKLLPILQTLGKTGLVSLVDDSILIDKEMRKYFEAQVIKFDPDFKPGMEFLQSLLKKVPISVLPAWYAIPRSSNNIFDSIVEKYLLSPQIFYRYLNELNFSDATLQGIIHDVYRSPDFKVCADAIMKKYGLSREQFEECVLHLEFHFVCCLSYQKVEEQFTEIVTPFYEWKEYLTFLKETDVSPIDSPQKVVRKRPCDFSFIQDMMLLLHLAKKQPFPLYENKEHQLLPPQEVLEAIAKKMEGFEPQDPAFLNYLHALFAKMRLLKLADVLDGRLYALDAANDWFDMRMENRALFLYRHPLNHLTSKHIPAQLCSERHVREAEKGIVRVLDADWVYFDDFVKGVITPLSEDSIIMLKRQGKTWKYSLPTYTEEEIALIKATVLEWLFEIGVTAVGMHEGKECFCVTPFGQSLFGR
ncbi:MAG TPA: hypothetical protein VGJ00_04740 [Rhabdochlamydiaceae bacterium]|jgi:hypothetical protein